MIKINNELYHSDYYTSKKNKRNGGTIKFKIINKWMKCNKCDEYLSKHYYIHQCDRLNRIYCNPCLIKKRKCQICNDSFVNLLKIKV